MKVRSKSATPSKGRFLNRNNGGTVQYQAVDAETQIGDAAAPVFIGQGALQSPASASSVKHVTSGAIKASLLTGSNTGLMGHNQAKTLQPLTAYQTEQVSDTQPDLQEKQHGLLTRGTITTPKKGGTNLNPKQGA